MEDLCEALGIEIPENEDYDTLGGMVLSCLRTIPEDGTHPQVTVNGLDIQVEVVEDHRIQSALVRKVEPAEAEKPAEEEEVQSPGARLGARGLCHKEDRKILKRD